MDQLSDNTPTQDLFQNIYKTFLQDPFNSVNAYELARWYKDQGHYASAQGLFIRAADYAENSDNRYNSLIQAFLCYWYLGGRFNAMRSILKTAIATDPTKATAYYHFSRVEELAGNMFDCYIYARAGNHVLGEGTKLAENLEHEWYSYGIPFQMALGAYHVGLLEESSKLYRELMFNYPLDEATRIAVRNNLTIINKLDRENTAWVPLVDVGWTSPGKYKVPDIHEDVQKEKVKKDFINHSKDKSKNLKVKFPRSNLINTNYSRNFEDIFATCITRGKTGGFFLDFGSGYPVYANNTYLLEKEFGWKGLSVDLSEEFIEKHFEIRDTCVLKKDISALDLEELFEVPHILRNPDYLSIDTEDYNVNIDLLEKLFEHDVTFNVLTITWGNTSSDDENLQRLKNLLSERDYIEVADRVECTTSNKLQAWYARPTSEQVEQINLLKTPISGTVTGETILYRI